MKTSLLALIVALTSFELRAQFPAPPPPMTTNTAQARLRMIQELQARRHALTNTAAANAAAAPGVPGVPGAAVPSLPPVPPAAPAAQPGAPTAGANPPAAPAAPTEETLPPGNFDFQGVDVNQVLDVYAKLVNRTILRGALPQAQIVLKTQTPLTKSEAIEALQAVLALNGVSLVNIGEKFVKAAGSDQAGTLGAEFNEQKASQLPDLGSYVTHIVQLHYLKPTEMQPVIAPFARLPNSIIPLDANGILVLRDNAENVKRMLEMIARVDTSVPAEYISEVIPIKYALASDIASALSSLGAGGGGGGGGASIGAQQSNPRISGFANNQSGGTGGIGGVGGINGMQGGATSGVGGGVNRPQATTAPAANSFQNRLQAIINRAGGSQQDQIQLFGETKIIADERSNSLLIFATKQDLATIKDIISKLDVLLSQVLIEAVIMDVNLNSSLNYGVSAVQNPQTYSPSTPVIGGGGVNNGQNILSFLNGGVSGLTNGTSLANNLSPGLSYFGNIGPNWDVAMQALTSDSHGTVIQRPRIQTSQAKPAQFFVGQTVPYITGYGNYGYGNQSSYSQLSVGVELDVTPFINPDGLVVMDINQEIDNVSGYTSIDGNNVPDTDKRTLSSEIAVRNRDTILLGGFIRTDKTISRSGVPLLQDIPLLGNLFTAHNNTKDREELVVLMRPTVLPTPESAAQQTIREEQRLPGVSAAEAEDAADEANLVEKERKAEQLRAKQEGKLRGFYNVSTTNTFAPPAEDMPFSAPPEPQRVTNNAAPPLYP
ncbi:MAG: secretin N-terminal domain-containing protein [Verrucomicrobiota bacterium]